MVNVLEVVWVSSLETLSETPSEILSEILFKMLSSQHFPKYFLVSWMAEVMKHERRDGHAMRVTTGVHMLRHWCGELSGTTLSNTVQAYDLRDALVSAGGRVEYVPIPSHSEQKLDWSNDDWLGHTFFDVCDEGFP